jgi:micrococcal nuclease
MALAGSLQGRAVSITDWDTIRVLVNYQEIKARLYGIDCPEKKQAFSRKAEQFTSGLVAGKQVILRTYGKDRYGRTVADVILTSGTNLNHEIVRDGFTWWYRKYAPNNRPLEALEREARQIIAGYGLMGRLCRLGNGESNFDQIDKMDL